MLLGHGSVAEHPFASIRGTGVINVGSAFISGLSLTSTVNSLESVTGSASVSASTNVATFSIGTETVTGTAAVDVTTAGQMTFSIGDETAFGEAFQNLVSLSVGEPDFFIWNEIDDSMTATYTDVEPGSTD
jgi:adenosylcobinamide amidohydrolase